MRIKWSTLYVDDQKKSDFSQGNYRWLTVVAADDAEGVELVLESNANPAGKAYQAAMRGKNVKPNTTASPTKIEEYYRTHLAEFTSKEEIHLRMIMIPSRASEGNAASQKAMAIPAGLAFAVASPEYLLRAKRSANWLNVSSRSVM